MSNIQIYIQIGVTAVCAIAYGWTFRYQSAKISSLEKLIESQSTLIGDFEKIKSWFNTDDFEKRLDIKLDTQKLELEQNFKKQSIQIVNETIPSASETFQDANKDILGGWNEFANIAIGVTLKNFPKKEDKPQRDKWIRKHYPLNAIYMIGFIDHYILQNNQDKDPK